MPRGNTCEDDVALFLSTYTNKVDKKGRVSVPAAFRSTLADQSYKGIISYPSFINECVEACGIDRIERLSESIDSLDPYSDERDAFATTILGGSVQMPFDSEGRVMLPESMIELARIKDQAVFVGKGSTFEIWQPELFTEYSRKARDLASRQRANLRLAANKKEGS